MLGGLVKLLLDIAIGTGVDPDTDAPDTLVGGLDETIELARVSGLLLFVYGDDREVAVLPGLKKEVADEGEFECDEETSE